MGRGAQFLFMPSVAIVQLAGVGGGNRLH